MKSISSIAIWAKSAGNRPIALYHSTEFEFHKQQRPLLFIGGVHGDEPEGVELAMRLLEHLKLSPKQHTYTPWILIPCLNPDGYENNSRTNANGVDLNRNYPAKNWQKEYEKDRYYPGTEAASEPEIKALVQLIESERPRLLIHFHSWKPCIIATGDKALVDAKRLADQSGYELQHHIGYETPGSLSQYAWHDLGLPVICIEEQEKSDLSLVWPHFGEALIEILQDNSMRN